MKEKNISLKLSLKNELATLKFGSKLASFIPNNFIVYLYGNLGAGKTTLVRGFLNALGHYSIVKSPTYTLVESYQLQGKHIHHIDLYRITDPEELELIGIRDYFLEEAICLAEWPEKAQYYLPTADLSCYILIKNSGREITLKSNTAKGRILLKKLRTSG